MIPAAPRPLVSAPLLPPARRPGALPWLVAATTVLMLLACAFTLALGRAADTLRATERRLIVQVIAVDPARRDRLAEATLARLRAQRDLTAVVRVPDGEVARLIDPYIGGMATADIPLPALIEADVTSGADVAAVARAVARPPVIVATPAARGTGAFTRLIGALRGTASLVMLVCVAATGLVAMLAARAALAADRASLSILHELGATDDQLAALVLRRIGREAAIGAGAGLVLGGVALAMVGARLAPLGLGGLGWGWLLLPLVPAGLVGLALLAGYGTLLLSFGRAP